MAPGTDQRACVPEPKDLSQRPPCELRTTFSTVEVPRHPVEEVLITSLLTVRKVRFRDGT